MASGMIKKQSYSVINNLDASSGYTNSALIGATELWLQNKFGGRFPIYGGNGRFVHIGNTNYYVDCRYYFDNSLGKITFNVEAIAGWDASYCNITSIMYK